jgi:hypothetical protein
MRYSLDTIAGEKLKKLCSGIHAEPAEERGIDLEYLRDDIDRAMNFEPSAHTFLLLCLSLFIPSEIVSL